MRETEILTETHGKLSTFEYEHGIEPNLIILSADLANVLKNSKHMLVSSDCVNRIFGIEVQIDYAKTDFIRVGYME